MLQGVRQAEIRLMLASMGVLAVSIAGLGAALAPRAWEHCLPLAGDIAPHCPACYVAIALFAAALSPWPRAARVRP